MIIDLGFAACHRSHLEVPKGSLAISEDQTRALDGVTSRPEGALADTSVSGLTVWGRRRPQFQQQRPYLLC